jgi:hypothetical protein
MYYKINSGLIPGALFHPTQGLDGDSSKILCMESRPLPD